MELLPRMLRVSRAARRRDRITQLAAAVRKVATPWHQLFLALYGALLPRCVPPEQLPADI